MLEALQSRGFALQLLLAAVDIVFHDAVWAGDLDPMNPDIRAFFEILVDKSLTKLTPPMTSVYMDLWQKIYGTLP